jgi:hypothetical protein
VSCRSDTQQPLQALFVIEDLEHGPHTLEIRTRSGRVSVDALDVLP